ncbi:radical SAM protein [bacterium]|nr:radical SAM protein [bacterium]
MSEKYLYSNDKSQPPKINVLMAFPGIYSFGMASLGFLNVFKMIDTIEGVYAERVFTDSKTTVVHSKDVDVIGFSMSFELDFMSIFKILEKFKIPFKAADRDENAPLIYGGGPVLSSNPEPYAEFFDLISLGDGCGAVQPIFEFIRDNRDLPKKELLKKLDEKFDFVYIPSLKTEKTVVKCNKAELPNCLATTILSEESFFSNTYVVEIERGCPKKCKFCQTSYLNHPVRYLDYDKIIASLDFGLKHTNKIALLGAAICAHPNIDDICGYIIKRVDEGENIEMSVSSLRADCVSPKTVEALVKCGQKSTTIAVEAGSERLRKHINKDLSDEAVFKAIDTITQNGINNIKVYMMIGLPTETKEDILAIVELGKEIKKKHKTLDLTFSFSSFIPKAHTPFETEEHEDIKGLEKKYAYLQKELTKIGVKIRCSSPKWDFWQAVLSVGGRELSDFLIGVYENGGNLGAFKSVWSDCVKIGKFKDEGNLSLKKVKVNSPDVWKFIKIYN